MTLREAGRRLDRGPEYIKGAAEGMGIMLVRVGRALVMSEADFGKLAGRLRKAGVREPAAASS